MRTFNLLAIVGVASALQVSTRGRASIRESTPVNNDFHLVAQDGEEEAAFIEWMNETGTSYATDEERAEAFVNWKRNNATIRDLNEQAANSGNSNPAMFNHNLDSDKSQTWLAQRLGKSNLGLDLELSQAKAAAAEKKYIDISNVDVKAQTADWSDYTKPVQSQGSCGSCWAVSGNTVLEATDYIFNGTRTMLSKQLPVSCQYWQSPEWNDGCDGGDAARMFTWYMNNGTLTDEAYPYSSESLNDGITGNCTADLNNLDKGLVTGVTLPSGDQECIVALQTRPLVGAFAVGDGFSFYSFGLIRNGDGNCESAGADPNHQMAVVGVDTVGESVMASTPVKYTYARWKPADGCDTENGEFEADWYAGTCLWEVIWDKQQQMPEGPYYKIQNSWGTQWGHGGFAYFAIDENEPTGNCSMHWEAMQGVQVRGE